MHPEFEKRYDFVIAYKYEPTGQKDADGDDTYYRHGRVLFLDPLSLSKREWTDPGKRFSLKSEVIFYPSVSKSGHLQISTIHPSGKWIVLARGSAQPPIGEPVTVRLIEKFSTMEAIPYQIGLSSILSEAEMEALEVRALSDQVINKPELPAGCVWDDNEQKPVWDVLNRHWAQLHVKLEASVFGPDMSLEDYRKCNRILRGLLQPDKVAGKSRIVQANRTKRASAVGYFLDVLEAYLEDQADKVTTTVQAPDNGESKPAEPVRELTPEEELRRKRSLAAKKAAETRRQNAAADRKRGKRTKPASA
ncbi:hypothetical protein KJ611_01555 [Patescibacteria group bacterium]|nr:hypothetical protein [Patescibacteria group bacterium]